MAKNIIRVTPNKKEAESIARRITKELKEEGISREAYVTSVSQGYVRKFTREGYKKGYKIPKRNYGVAVRYIVKKRRCRK